MGVRPRYVGVPSLCGSIDSLLSLLGSSLLSSASLGGFMLSVLGFLLSLSYFLRVTRATGFCRTRSRALQNRRGATDWFRRLRSRADWLRSRAGCLRATLPLFCPHSRRYDAPESEFTRDHQHSPCDKFGRKVHIVSYVAECSSYNV